MDDVRQVTSGSGKDQKKNIVENLQKERLINDVRYQDGTEMTLDYNKMFLESDRKQ